MVWDYIRTAYSCKMILWSNHPRLIDVRWFRAAPGALFAPGPHRFGSKRWETVKRNGGLGEQLQYPRPYYKGTNWLALPGKRMCGDRQAILNGGVWGQTPVIYTDADGMAACCKSVDCLGGGGAWSNGAARFGQAAFHAQGGSVAGGAATFYQAEFRAAGGAVSNGLGTFNGVDLVAIGGAVSAGNAIFAAGGILVAQGGAISSGGSRYAGVNFASTLEAVSNGSADFNLGVSVLGGGAVSGGTASWSIAGAYVLRLGVRGEVWYGRNPTPTHVLRLGVRGEVWYGRNPTPTHVLRLGVRGEY